ncbi:hypothetical protein BO99DRAFT_78581 [Aspergillus violaceofuscus CBS 115571]|uniref:Uncharacterized protein n=1 Tax=Aspergillus violaceofuscus (strain CBS 115571) TaxID=1450538 RepID=A0A2V5GXF4_ASPV1|nr:hypothetical protein BO99DRAFT_78581 [Aspergillus violaceofuscus CBS 115571]
MNSSYRGGRRTGREGKQHGHFHLYSLLSFVFFPFCVHFGSQRHRESLEDRTGCIEFRWDQKRVGGVESQALMWRYCTYRPYFNNQETNRDI